MTDTVLRQDQGRVAILTINRPDKLNALNQAVRDEALAHLEAIADDDDIGAVVLTGAKIGKRCIIGANSLIPEHKEIPDNSLVMGSPGRVVRQVEDRHIQLIHETVDHYVNRWKRYVQELREDEG